MSRHKLLAIRSTQPYRFQYIITRRIMSTTTSPGPSFTETWHTTTYPAISPTRPELSAKGKSVIITGGGSGIGARTASSFAAAGASNVAILGRTEARLEETKQNLASKFPDVGFHSLVVNVTDRKATGDAFATFSKAVGKVDILINNAGYAAPLSFIKSLDIDEAFLSLDINVKGSVIVAHAFAQIAASDAVIVNVTSIISFLPFAPGYSSYAVSKAATARLFDAVQYEHPEWRVYNIQPGTIDTPMARSLGIPGKDDGMSSSFHTEIFLILYYLDLLTLSQVRCLLTSWCGCRVLRRDLPRESI